MIHSSKRFLLTVKSNGGLSQKKIWDGQHTLALGHPFKWVLEKTEQGVRVRSLQGKVAASYSDGAQEITHQQLQGNVEVQVEGGSISFFPVKNLPAVFSESVSDTGDLRVYFCLKNSVVGTAPLRGSYTARVQGKKVFQISKNSSGVKVHATVEGVEIITPDGVQNVVRGNALTLTPEQAQNSRIHWGSFYWFVRSVATPKGIAARVRMPLDEETRWFKKSILSTFGALTAFLILIALWPKPEVKKEEELIPPQFAKLVMARPQVQKSETASNSAPAPENAQKEAEAPKKVAKAKDVKVVQAFRAKALQNAVSGLLKGGMTNLLSQSELLTGTDSSKQARRMLDGKAIAGLPSAPVTGLTGNRSVEVSAIGGSGAPGGVGYGKGQKAGVAGQGKAYVSLDLGNSTVEEGLTKEEVGRVIHAHMSEIRYCYESSMIRNSDLEGKLMLDFVIGANGMVRTANVKESTIADARLDDCVIRRLTKWQFPKPKGGVNVSVSYPFIFKTLGR